MYLLSCCNDIKKNKRKCQIIFYNNHRLQFQIQGIFRNKTYLPHNESKLFCLVFPSATHTLLHSHFTFFGNFRWLHLIWGFVCLCHFKSKTALCWKQNHQKKSEIISEWNQIGIYNRGSECFFPACDFLSFVACNDSKRHFWNNKRVVAQLQIDRMQLSCSIRFMIYHISFMLPARIVSSPISVINDFSISLISFKWKMQPTYTRVYTIRYPSMCFNKCDYGWWEKMNTNNPCITHAINTAR